MTRKQVLEDISSLIQDIDKCTEDYVEALNKSNKELYDQSTIRMPGLLVAAHQELTFLYDYIKEGGKDDI